MFEKEVEKEEETNNFFKVTFHVKLVQKGFYWKNIPIIISPK